jgi:ankyrin repeat protein
LNTHPFLRHASTAWTYYLRKTDAATQLDDQILGFFSEKRRSAFMAWVQVLNAPSNFKWDLYPRHTTLLYYAASFGLDSIVERLLEKGADRDVPGSRFGGTALHGAVLRCQIPVIKRLLQAGAAPSRADSHGVTPLHTAAANRHAGPIELLLEYGASVTVKDRGGETPMDWAVNAGQKPSQELLTGASVPCEKDVEKADHVYTGYVNYFPSG